MVPFFGAVAILFLAGLDRGDGAALLEQDATVCE